MSTCPRLFEAEAMRDGRLGDAERASFERHVNGCAACSGEVAALDGLATALREGDASADDLHARRERTRLLAAFDRELVTAPRASRPASRVLAAALILALVGGVLVFWRSRPAPSPPRAPSTALVQTEDAVWTRGIVGEREKVVLERGELRISVRHAAGQHPLLVVLPDGELEDTGTTFTVSAEHGRTKRVAVEEGSVVLRLRGEEARTLRAGEVWTAEMQSEADASAAIQAPEVSPAPAASPAVPAITPDASLDFRAAMALLNGGDDGRAAAAFESFIAKHPRDARAEDAAYLRVVALQRVGDDHAMNAAARDYLRRHPTGFRSAEVERLAR